MVLAALAACGGSDSPTAGDRSYDAVSYELRASLDFTGSFELSGIETITVALGDSPAIELDAKVAVLSVRADGGDLPFSVGNGDDGQPATLRVDLSSARHGDDPVTFTVEYTAEPSDALLIGGPRDDDPDPNVVVFTDSEPDRAKQWLVCKDDPADRALWAVEVSVDGDRDVVANGARVVDEPTDTGHRVRYEIGKPIPTYLMAFAAGDLAHEDRTTGRVPLSVWHRKGLPLDANATLDVVADAMATFEALIGPYPWDSYGVFLAPQYGGGMENATITFNAETSGLGNVSFGLNAHELAHHWFGDWVTMHRYEDVWVKEGMATLLAAEAQRARRDKAGTGRLFGDDFTYSQGDAMVDPELHGLDKYTTGPYERSAWTITQIRKLVGDDAFWASLRQVLADHALDSITGEDFLAAFPLQPAQVAQLTAALTAHDSPQLAFADAGGGSVTLSVTDPAGTLVAPIGITAVDANGTAVTQNASPGAPATVTIPAGGYLALDEADVHPYLAASFDTAGYDVAAGLELPGSAAAVAAFGARSPSVQETALGDDGLPSTQPADVTALYNALDSTIAQRTFVLAACGALSSLPATDKTALEQALAPFIRTPALPNFTSSYASCGTAVTTGALATELTQLVDAVTPATAGRLDYLMAFDYGPTASFTALSKLATTAPTLALRDRAIQRLGLQAAGRYTDVPAADVPMWQAFFRDRLANVTSQGRLLNIWRGVVGLSDATALPLVAPLLHSVPLAASAQRQIVCDSFNLAGANPSAAAWQAFVAAVQPANTLSSDAQDVLGDPTKCNAGLRSRTSAERRPKI